MPELVVNRQGVKSPVRTEFYPCEMFPDEIEEDFKFDDENDDKSNNISKCRSECVKRFRNDSGEVRQPVSKSQTLVKRKERNYGQYYQPKQLKKTAPNDYVLINKSGLNDSKSTPLKRQPSLGRDINIYPGELRQTRPRFVSMPPPPRVITVNKTVPITPPPGHHIYQQTKIPAPQLQPTYHNHFNDRAVFSYHPRYFVTVQNKYRVLPPVYANFDGLMLRRDPISMTPAHNFSPVYQAHYQSHNEINPNYARLNSFPASNQPIYAVMNSSSGTFYSGQQPRLQSGQQQPKQYQPYPSHQQIQNESMGDQGGDGLPRKKSIISSILTFPKFVFRGFK